MSVATKSNVAALLEQRRMEHDIKLAIVTKCQSVMQSPESQTSTLRTLIKSFESLQILSSKILRRLLIASLCAVFKDILPSYKIRSMTEQEKTQLTKKETRKIRFYEENLLRHYRKYINIVLIVLNRSAAKRARFLDLGKLGKFSWTKNDRISALRCACQLIEAHPYFNFTDELVSAVIPYLNNGDRMVLNEALSVLRNTFISDLDGNITLTICRGIHVFCRKRKYIVKPSVVKPMSWIPLLDVKESCSGSVDSRKKLLSRRDKKKLKLELKHQKDMENTQAIQSRERRTTVNTHILNEILFVYFKILKTTTDSSLFSAVLEGLSRRTEFINLIYVDSLLSLLGRFIDNQLSLMDSLHCVHTALSILSHSSSTTVLQTDPTRFCNHLYVLLGRMCGCSGNGGDSNTIVANQNSNYYTPLKTPASHALAEHLHKVKITSSSTAAVNAAVPVTSQEAKLNIVGRLTLKEAERLTDLILSCLDLLLIRRRRDVSTNRVLAFVKRLAGVALCMPHSTCTAVILIRLIHLLRLFPRCEVLFDSETEVGGIYQPESDDPETCLPGSACMWELTLLQNHTSPLVKHLSTLALSWGSTAYSHGATEACVQQASIKCSATNGVPLDSLIQMSPKDCRRQVQNIEWEWMHHSGSETAPRNLVGRKRTIDFQPSPWLTNSLTKFKLFDLMQSHSCAKRSKSMYN